MCPELGQGAWLGPLAPPADVDAVAGLHADQEVLSRRVLEQPADAVVVSLELNVCHKIKVQCYNYTYIISKHVPLLDECTALWGERCALTLYCV